MLVLLYPVLNWKQYFIQDAYQQFITILHIVIWAVLFYGTIDIVI